MEPHALIDTHIAIWLFDGEFDRLPDKAQDVLRSNSTAISPIAELELNYLYEIGRLKPRPDQIISTLASHIGLQITQTSLNQVCRRAVDLTWTRDPFDRMQAAQALLTNSPFVTKDPTILDNLELAVWD